MKGADVRQAFLDYFISKGHQVVASSSLVPENDPTLLFNNAGMNQFKEAFLGTEKRPYNRAASCQKCMRISGKHNDLENVGVTARHHTFFEMLGNFSFGDYFKAEAIQYGWEFVTEVLKLPRERLWVSVFEEDDEAYRLWSSLTDCKQDRILRLGAEDNFWAMGETGPCGPCSEIHYYIGDDVDSQSEEEFRKDDGTYLEIWNLVFMQFNRDEQGNLEPLPAPSVDTGMGLERIASIMQGKKANYDCDLLHGVIELCEKLSGFKYDGSSYEERDIRTDKAYARDVAMRVIADHSRSVAFLLGDGVHPGSDGRGYVLRRLIRRAIRHGQALEFKEPFLAKTTKKVIEALGDAYPELKEREEIICRIADAEERKFHETLDSGMQYLDEQIAKLKKGQKFPGETAFLLHDTYGFPLDLTQNILKSHGIEVDEGAFNSSMQAQKERSREDRKSHGHVFSSVEVAGEPTCFIGYTEQQAEAKLLKIVPQDDQVYSLLFDSTPFYAEAGGQVGDTGLIEIKDTRLRVLDTQKVQGKYFLHQCTLEQGELLDSLCGEKAVLSVDQEKRAKTAANHSATHLVHSALRRVLGDHVKQAGSRVDYKTLRFDYSHFEAVTPEQQEEIQSLVNADIRSDFEVTTREMPIDEARKLGAMALFGEKYGDVVRVVQIGPESIELCGGTHVGRSGEIGFLSIASDGGISAGVRRIECYSGSGAEAVVQQQQRERNEIVALLKGDSSNLPEKISKLLERQRELERELANAKAKLASAASSELAGGVRTSPAGVKVVVETVEGADTGTLRSMVDRLRVQIGSGVVALAGTQGEKAVIVAGVTSDLTDKINAGKLVKEAAAVSGGKGGGRADFAQAGGVNSQQVSEALDKIFELVA